MRNIAITILCAFLVSCQKEQQSPAPLPQPAAPPIAESAVPVEETPFKGTIQAVDFAAHVEKLASDEFEGRAPGTMGERATTAYLKDQFLRMGLKPGNGDSFFQSVPMVEHRLDGSPSLFLRRDQSARALTMPEDIVLTSPQNAWTIEAKNSPLVFVGYGVNAPEQGWNDYAGIDVKGKTVVVLVNDPGFFRKDPALFKGKTMTYYGRWTYKFEEAARQGAAGCLIVHDTEGAGYDWNVVESSWTGAQFDLPASETTEPRLQFQGWITAEAAERLFEGEGRDFRQLRLAADQVGFKPIELTSKIDVMLRQTTKQTYSENVIATLPGIIKPEEAVFYVAHWDHLGYVDAGKGKDGIFNGAIDNATGVAAVLEIAEAFASATAKPRRSVYFLLTTLEESGLLGAKYYAQHPGVPPENMLAAINIDALAVRGRTKDVGIIGQGQSDLEMLFSEAVAQQGRVIAPEANAEKGYYFRSDHFVFAKLGIPALYIKTGTDMRNGGTAAGERDNEDYLKKRYHQPSDAFDPHWDLRGAVEDLQALYEVGRKVANGQQKPQWYPTSEFKAAAEKLRGGN